jgi:hypothetical protein
MDTGKLFVNLFHFKKKAIIHIFSLIKRGGAEDSSHLSLSLDM